MIFMFDIQLKKRLSRNYNYQESILIKKNFKHILFWGIIILNNLTFPGIKICKYNKISPLSNTP